MDDAFWRGSLPIGLVEDVLTGRYEGEAGVVGDFQLADYGASQGDGGWIVDEGWHYLDRAAAANYLDSRGLPFKSALRDR